MKKPDINIIRIFKKPASIFLIIVFMCCFFAVQSCGDGGGDKGSTTEESISEEKEAETAEQTTPAPTTEPPTTTEKPPIIREEVLKWTFTEEDKVFRSSSQTKDIRVEDGIFKFTTTGSDPNIMTISSNLGIEAADIAYINFKIKVTADGDANQLFFVTTENTGWDEAKSMKSSYWNTDGEDWEILEYDTSDCFDWEGTIKQIRFDPMNGEGTVEIEYVSFERIVK